MKTLIILIKYAAPEFEKECLRSVIENTTCPHHMVVCDNYPENRNLGALWNEMINRFADAEYVCLLNTDTRVEIGWLTRLVEVLQENPDAGAVGPTTNRSHNRQSNDPGVALKSVVDFGKLCPDEALSGFCLVFPRHVWEKVKFPEDFGFYGQEVAWLDRVKHAGYKLLWCQDVFVWHAGSASVKLAQARGEINELAERRAGRARVNEERSKLK